MIDVSTATAEEVVKDAVRITQMVNAEPSLSTGVLTELINWLCAYTMRLRKALNGIPCETQEAVQEEIRQWSEAVKRHSKD